MAEIVAELKCPNCQTISEVEMPTNLCLVRYQCKTCVDTIVPKKGDCCVFCSYANIICPPKQDEAFGTFFPRSPLVHQEDDA